MILSFRRETVIQSSPVKPDAAAAAGAAGAGPGAWGKPASDHRAPAVELEGPREFFMPGAAYLEEARCKS